jgi:hypothetical protein
MKKIFLYSLIISLGLSFTACEDFLKEEAFGEPTTEELMKDPENMALLVGQAYAELKWLHDHWGYWGLNTLTSDEARCPIRKPGNHWDDSGYWKSLNSMTWDYKGKAIEWVWETSIEGANLCNQIRSQIAVYKDDVDPKQYAQFEAELLVLRSYYYYAMFDLFGRIPYAEEYTSDKTAQFPLLDAKVVWKKLVDCLEANVEYMPDANVPSKAQNYGRVTKGFAYALLARLYLNAASYGVDDVTDPYGKCIEYCNKVINSNAYSIEDNFFTNFLVNNEISDENIFVIVENGNPSFDPRSKDKMSNKLRLNLLTQHYSFNEYYTLLEKPWNGFAASKQFLALYEAADRRGPCPPSMGTDVDFQDINKKYGWFLGPIKIDGKVLKDENGNEAYIKADYKSQDGANWWDGARLMKYETEVAPTINQYMENDFVLFRYADVLYMKAEAILRSGSGNIAEVLSLKDFQQIRTRAGLNEYTAATLTLDEILDERGREFAWENVRRRDLIRFGKYTGRDYMWDFKASGVEDHRVWFPIPKKFMDMHILDDIPWEQNPGY